MTHPIGGERPWRRGRIIACTLIVGVALVGCTAVPTAVTVVGVVADGLSYATTGKGTADHLISSATDQDCALYRSLGNSPVCRDATLTGEPVAVADAGASNARPGLPTALRDPVVQTLAPRPAPRPGNVREIMRRHTLTFIAANK